MTISTRTPAPATTPVAGAGACAEPSLPWANFRPTTTRDHIAYRAATDPDIQAWLRHVAPAGACTRPIRLAGRVDVLDASSRELVSRMDTATMPDGLIYKACGNRRSSVCPACSKVYQRDAYQILRSMLVGGKGVPATVAKHSAVFATFTAPSFGPVHTRIVKRHTCTNRRRCDCRPEPCHARRTAPACPHGHDMVCWARHDAGDVILGRPLCLDCYDHDHQVVWNLAAGDLWRRTKQAAERYLAGLARQRGIPRWRVVGPDGKTRYRPPVRLSHGKVAEMQRRGVAHFHALIRLDGINPADPAAVVPPPAGFTSVDLEDALRYAATHTTFTTPPHPDRPGGWPIGWGEQVDVRHLTLTGRGEVTDAMAAGYLAKYATKSTEATGHTSARLTADTIDLYADPDGDHIARLIDACWRLGRPTRVPAPLGARAARCRPAKALGPRWTCPTCHTPTRLRVCLNCEPSRQDNPDTQPPPRRRPTTGHGTPTVAGYGLLRRWAHMLGFGGHFLTKARHGVPTFGLIRAQRVTWRRTENRTTDPIRTVDHTDDTTLVVGSLTFAGAGWHNSGDAALAATSAAMARARRDAARDALNSTAPGTALQHLPATVSDIPD